jgi:hypothetical protein
VGSNFTSPWRAVWRTQSASRKLEDLAVMINLWAYKVNLVFFIGASFDPFVTRTFALYNILARYPSFVPLSPWRSSMTGPH